MAKSSAAIGLVLVISSCGTHPQASSEAQMPVAVVPQSSVYIPMPSEPKPGNTMVEPKAKDGDLLMASDTADGLRIEDMRNGRGEPILGDETMTIHYVGRLPDGIVFDSSRDRGEAFRFRAEQVIRGLAQGMKGMRIGGMRRLTIPPALGYGDRKLGKIPPGSTLVFEVELLKAE